MDWRPGSDKIRQKDKNAPTCDVPQTAKEKKNFSISTRRLSESVECLNNCRAQSASELWIVMELKSLVKKVAAVDVRRKTCLRVWLWLPDPGRYCIFTPLAQVKILVGRGPDLV